MADAAIPYRMVRPDPAGPFGVRAGQLLHDAGHAVDDRILRARGEVDAFKAERGIDTTSPVVIDDAAIGGSDDVERYLAARE